MPSDTINTNYKFFTTHVQSVIKWLPSRDLNNSGHTKFLLQSGAPTSRARIVKERWRMDADESPSDSEPAINVREL